MLSDMNGDYRAVVAFGLEALIGRHDISKGVMGKPWDSRNARDLIQYTVDGHKISAWESGELSPPLESPRDTSVVSNFDPILILSIVLSSEPLTGNANLKGWKNALVGKSDTVDPNFVPVYSQSEERTSFELLDVVLDRILQNMTNTLVGKFFSLCPTVEMVQKWVKDKWKLKGSVSVSAMHGALFLFKFTVEEDVAHVLSGCVDEITRSKSCMVYAHFCVQATAPTPPLLKLKGLTLGEDPVPNAPIIHHDLAVGPVIPPTTGPNLPPLVVEDPVIEEYPFAKSVINLLQSPAKIVDKASIPAWMVQCMSSTASLVSLAGQLEDGEIARDPSLVPETIRSPLVAPPLNQGLSSLGAF
ncbi:hypothetical protein SUGI_0050310, partial [Cryptomeria japonica]